MNCRKTTINLKRGFCGQVKQMATCCLTALLRESAITQWPSRCELSLREVRCKRRRNPFIVKKLFRSCFPRNEAVALKRGKTSKKPPRFCVQVNCTVRPSFAIHAAFFMQNACTISSITSFSLSSKSSLTLSKLPIMPS